MEMMMRMPTVDGKKKPEEVVSTSSIVRGKSDSWSDVFLHMDIWDPLKPAETPSAVLGPTLTRPINKSNSTVWPRGSMEWESSEASSKWKKPTPVHSTYLVPELNQDSSPLLLSNPPWVVGSRLDSSSSSLMTHSQVTPSPSRLVYRVGSMGSSSFVPAALPPTSIGPNHTLTIQCPPSSQPTIVSLSLSLPPNSTIFFNGEPLHN